MEGKFFPIVKEYIKHHYAGHVLAAFLFCAAAPLLMGIEALNPQQSAQVLEMYFSIVGIVLLVPLFMPDQSRDIRDVVAARETPMLYIHSIRLLTGLALLAVFLLGFLLWMQWGECQISLRENFGGTFANCLFLGGLGICFFGIFDNLPVAYMIPMFYYIANYGGRKYFGSFYLFSMMSGGKAPEKLWLAAGGILLILLGIWWRDKGKRCMERGSFGKIF